MILRQLLEQNTHTSLLRAFIPLPPPFSPVQFIELRLNNAHFWRCFDDGSAESSEHEYGGKVSDSSLHLVLLAQSDVLELRFVRTDNGQFTEQDNTMFSWLARLASQALEAQLSQVALSESIETLREERDHDRVLVDITNSVLSHLDLDDLIADVSQEIHRFFGIDNVRVVLRDTLHSRQLICHATHFPSCPPETERFALRSDSPVVLAALNENQGALLHQVQDAGLWQRDPVLQQLLMQGLNVVFILPLTFSHHAPGVLLLAHRDASIFSEQNCRLLQQIADRIGIAVDNADAYRQVIHLKENLNSENRKLNEQIASSQSFGDIIYQSDAMRDVLQQVNIVALSDSTVLILGETGTGKEIIARALHQMSPRKDKPLVKINCAAIPASLLESELFGHDKGAFTGAINAHRGRFEMADEGTLFLDEIGDMPLELQPKLLRVLQEREIERIGGTKTIPVNVRVIAATNRDLRQMVIDREFRNDLFYRLNVFPLVLPPLRERPDDIPLLARYFTQKLARRLNRTIDTIPADTIQQLMRYEWPGNVRELENVIERAVLLARDNTLNLHLHAQPVSMVQPVSHDPFPFTLPKVAEMMRPEPPENDEAERQQIIQVLRETNGIVAGPRGAAAKLGMKRTTLLSRMQRLGIAVREVL
ncbi:sigma 54-interacting transcriptional regulator [Kosakonia sacchari]|uniref:Sigma 54-interacting transcriptional regulator n=1 Tax=Kosakonia sacchari TaxID=1158459 RepID=A0ABZ0MVA4_9ENTR|nr:sigma 54-interacting transcriptional regulator [Kosakonia sacchari]WOZ78644.1 sigma 54-interacting transcriptional regulator [Kosakonia sacchari]